MIDLTQMDDLALSVFLCQGTMPFHRHLDQDELFMVHSGTISIESDWGNRRPPARRVGSGAQRD